MKGNITVTVQKYDHNSTNGSIRTQATFANGIDPYNQINHFVSMDQSNIQAHVDRLTALGYDVSVKVLAPESDGKEHNDPELAGYRLMNMR